MTSEAGGMARCRKCDSAYAVEVRPDGMIRVIGNNACECGEDHLTLIMWSEGVSVLRYITLNSHDRRHCRKFKHEMVNHAQSIEISIRIGMVSFHASSVVFDVHFPRP